MEALQNSQTAQLDRAELDCVHGQIGFLSRTPEEGPFVACDVMIRNARPHLNELSLDREGFALVRHEMPGLGERDAEELSRNYADEMVPFIKDYFKASWVLSMRDSTLVRRSGLAVTHGLDGTSVPGVRTTAGVAHMDFTPIASPLLAARESQEQGVPLRSYSRLMIINAWRCLTPPPQDLPLAVCDSATVFDDDLVMGDFTEPRTGFTWKAATSRYNDHQRWYYFPNMTPDEVLLFKGYDSDKTFKVAHGAFDNRAAFPNAGDRQSVEARFFVYYE